MGGRFFVQNHHLLGCLVSFICGAVLFPVGCFKAMNVVLHCLGREPINGNVVVEESHTWGDVRRGRGIEEETLFICGENIVLSDRIH